MPITSFEDFVCAHMYAKNVIEDYLFASNSNYQKLELQTRFQVVATATMYMYANNPYSRIALVRAALEHAAHLLDPVTQPSPLFLVSLVPMKFTVELSEAHEFDPERVRRWTKHVLEGFDSLGMVEAAIITNVYDGYEKKMVSWHSHSLVWNTTRKKLEARMRQAAERNPSLVPGIVPGISAVDIEDVFPERAEHQLIYISKAPMSEYRLIRKQSYDPKTGEIIERYDQEKSELRAGDRVRMCKVMANHYLHRLLLGTGEGAEIYRNVTDDLLREYRAFTGRRW